MRIDKLLSEMGIATRKEAASAAKRGGVLINGVPQKDCAKHVDPEKDRIVYLGREVVYQKYRYIMLNKPEGYVSATEDGKDPTVLDLLPEEYGKFNLFPCGRLDKNTLGLMLITDNGELSHRLLSPKRHVKKTYAYRSKFPLTDKEKEVLEDGVILDDGYETKPAEIELDNDRASGYITLTEGKYHQIKRMFEAVHNKITYLERVTFGPLYLDSSLGRGEWRELTEKEILALEDAAK
ncbi:MAG: rRNA pseudouridine synthase [Clostridia bacterium]|nr:rRNA pseudouridine synthase [Clostridia bacterium]